MNKPTTLTALISLLLSAVVSTSVQAANGVPALMPFQARVTDAGGSPVNYPVVINLRVYPPGGACYVYEETFNVTPNPFGIFSVVLGAGAVTGPANTIPQVFNNDSAGIPDSCAATYVPGPNDWRRLEIVVDGVPLGAMQTIGAAGFAVNSQLLSGRRAEDFVNIGTNITQANIESLVDGSDVGALHNHDAAYARLGANNTFTGNLSTNGNIYTTGVGSAIGIGTGAASADLHVRKDSPTIRLEGNSGMGGTPRLDFYGGATQRGSIQASEGSNGLRLYSGATLGITLDATANALFSASVRTAGTVGVGTYSGASETALTTFLAGSGASAIGTIWSDGAGQLKYWNGASAVSIANSGSVVNSITAGNGITLGGTATAPSIAVAYGSAANTAIQGNATFAGDVSGAYTALTVDRIKNIPIDFSTAPVAGNVLRYDGTNFIPSSISTTLGFTPVNRAGDTMTGLLVLSADPSAALGAASKQYVDAVSTAAAAAYLRRDATTSLTANWDADGAGGGTILITGLANPAAADGAATKGYVDGRLLGNTLAAPGAGQVSQSIRWNAGNTAWEYFSPGDALQSGNLGQFAATTSAQLAGVLSNETGTGAAVFGTSPTLTTASLTTPTINTSFNLNGTTSGGVTFTVATTGASGTYTWPSAVPGAPRVLQSDATGALSWIAAAGGDALTTNPLSQFAATTSAQLAGVLSNETGSGAAVFGTSPTITTPTIATGFTVNGSTSGATTINAAAVTTNGTYTWPAAVPAGNRILQTDNTGALSWVTASTGDALVANPLSQFAATTSAQLAGVLSNETGTGVAVFATAPTFTTSIGINGTTSGGITISAPAAGSSGSYVWPSAVPAGNRILQTDNTGALSWVTASTGDALVANPLSQFAATTSAQLAGVLSNETGTGVAVFGTSPTITTPSVGTGITFNGATNGSFTLNAPSAGATGTYVWPSAVPAGNRVLQTDNAGNLTWVTAAVGDALTTNPLSQFAATTSVQLAGVVSNESGTGSLIFGTSPSFVSSIALNGGTSGGIVLQVPAAGSSGTYTWPTTAPAGNRVLQSDATGALTWVSDANSGGDALVANPLSQFAATTSAQLAGVLSNETGTGLAVFGTSPTLVTPSVTSSIALNGGTSGGIVLQVPAAGSSGTYTWPTTAPAGNRVLQSDATGALTWVSDANSGGDALVANPLSQFAATTSAQLRGVLSDESGTGAAVFATSASLTTPTISQPNLVSFNLNGLTSGGITMQVAATGAAGTYTWPSAVPAGNRVLQSDNTGALSWITASVGDALTTNPLSQFAATTSAQLAGVLSNETGTGIAVFGTSPTITTPVIGTGYTVNGSTSGSFTINAPAAGASGTYVWPSALPGSNRLLQSDSSGNLTWIAAGGGGDAFVANPLSQFAATTSAQLAGVLSNETGTGVAVFGTSPTLTTPTLTTPTITTGFTVNGSTSGATTINAAAVTTNGTYTWPAAVPAGNRILQSDNIGALTWVTASTGDALVANPLSQFAATTSAQLAGVLSNETGSGAAVFGTSPTLVTPAVTSSIAINGGTSGGITLQVPAAGSSGTYTWPTTVPAGNRILQSDNTGLLTWVTASTGDALVANPLSQFAATTSAQLAGVLSNETGSGAAVFGTSPTITTPVIGTSFQVSGSTNGGVTFAVPAAGSAGTYTWPGAVPGANRILQTDNTGALSWVTASTGDALVANPLSQFAATTSAQLAGVLSNETGTGLAVFATAPTFTTSIGINGTTSGGVTIAAPTAGSSGSYVWPSAVPAGNRVLQSDNTGALSWVTASTGDALVANPLSQFAATTSAQLAGVLSNETGSGVAVFGTSPTITTPTLTTPTITTGFTVNGSTSGATTINAAAVTTNGTYTWPAAVPAGNRILQSDNTGALSWVTASTGDALVANPLSQFAATTSAQLAGVLSNETGTGVAVFGTSPTIVTPSITSSIALNGGTSGGITLQVPAAGSSGTYTWPTTAPAGNRILQSDNTGLLTWVTASTGDALVANPLSQFAATTSAQLRGVLSDESGTGAAVFATSASLTTPTISQPNLVSFNLNGLTSGGITMQVAATGAAGTYTWPSAVPGGNRILQSDNTGALSWVTAAAGDALVANPLSQFAATTSAQLAGVLSNETGTGVAVFGTSPTITTPAIGTGYTVNGSTSGSFTINAPAAGASGTYIWPSAIPAGNRLLQTDNAGNLTWIAAGGGGDAFTTNPLSQFAATTSAQLAGVLSNETGSGLAVFGTSPTLVTPAITTSLALNGATSGGATIQVAATGVSGTYTWPTAVPAGNRVLQSDNTGALSWVTASTGDALTTNPLSQFAATTSAQLAGVLSNETGTGVSVFATAPTFTTSIGINGTTSGGITIAAPTAGSSGSYVWPSAVPAGNRVLQSDNTGALSWVTASTGDALVANPLSQFAATTSAQLAGVLSNETGSGLAVFGTSPTITTPTIATGFTVNGSTSGATTINAAAVTTNGTYTWPSAVPAGNRVLQSDNTGALSWVTASTGDALVSNPLSQFAATTSAQLAGVLSNETGSGLAVFGTSPTLVTPAITTSLALNGATSGGATIQVAATGVSGTYTWPTAVPAGNRVLQSDNTGALSWVTASTGDALVANPLSQFAATTSAQLAGVLSNETGSGLAVFGTSPTITTPTIATGFTVNGSTSGATTINAAAVTTNGTYIWPAAIPAGNRVLQSDNTGALSWVTAATGDALVANPLSQFAATTSAQLAGVLSNETGSGAAVFGTSPSITTATLVTPSITTNFSLNGAVSGGMTMQIAAAGATGTYTWPSAAPAGNRILQSDNTGALSWVTASTGDALVANPLSQFAATTSAQLAGVLSNETGTGVAVFATAPTFTTSIGINGTTSGGITIAAPTAGSSGAYTWPSAVPAGNRVLQSDNTGALSWVTAAVGDALTTNPLSQFAATTSAQLSGVISNETGSGSLVFGTSPTFSTGFAIAGSTSGTATINAAAVTTNGTYTWPAAIPAGNRVLQSDNTGVLSWVTAATGDALVANPLSQFAATTSAQLAGVLSNETGSGAAVFGTSPTLVTPAITTSIALNGATSGGATIQVAATGVSGTYTWPTAVPGSSRILQSDNTGALSWVAAATGDALVANPLSQFAATTSAQLAGVLSNETGSGLAVFGTSPTITTPTIATGFTVNGSTSGATTINAAAVTTNGTYTWPAAIPAGNRVLQSDNTGALSWVTASTGDALVANPLSQFAATTSAQLAGVISNETGSGSLVFGTSPTFSTGFAIAGSTSGTAIINAAAVTTNGTYTWPAAVPASNRVLQSDNTGALSWVTAATGDALVANPLSQFAATTSAQLAGVLSNETGTGVAVFGTSPTITTPTLTTPTITTGFTVNGSTSGSTTINAAAVTTNGTYTWPAAVPAGNRVLQSDNTGALSWITASAGDALVANPLSQFAATTSAQLAGVLSNETGTGLAVFGTSPTLTTPTIATGFTVNGSTIGAVTFNAAAITTSGTYTWPAAIPVGNRVLQSDNTGVLSWVTAGGDALTTNPLSQFAATTSAQLAGVLSNETGTGLAVFDTTPTIKGFTLGGATSGGIAMQVAATGAAGTYTWPSAVPAGNRVLQTDNTGALSWVTDAGGDALTTGNLSQFAATTSAQLRGVLSDETGTGLSVFATSPTLTTPTISQANLVSYNLNGVTSGGITMQVAATGAAGTYTWPSAVPGANRIMQTDSAGNLSWISTSAELAGVLTNETGTGVAAFATSPTFTTDITTPMIIGGTGTTSTLTYKTTSGVGTTNADHIFLVGNNGATEAMRILNSGSIGIGTASVTAGVKLEVLGTIRATNLLLTSDRRAKENIVSLDSAESLRKIMTVRPVMFDWKEDGSHDSGVIAQELRNVFPYMVNEGDDGSLSVKYTSLISPLIGSVQELNKKNESLAKENAELTARLQNIERETASVKNELKEIKDLIKSKK